MPPTRSRSTLSSGAGWGSQASRFVVPAHCTGWKATHALAARFPEAFLQNSVGTRFEFKRTEPSV